MYENGVVALDLAYKCWDLAGVKELGEILGLAEAKAHLPFSDHGLVEAEVELEADM